MARSRKHFQRQFGGRSVTFVCQVCDRRTRDTGQGVDHLCEQCFDIAGLDNEVNDDGLQPGMPRYESIRAECEALLEKARRVYRSYGYAPIDTPALEYTEIRGGGAGGTVLSSEGGNLVVHNGHVNDNGGHIAVNQGRRGFLSRAFRAFA